MSDIKNIVYYKFRSTLLGWTLPISGSTIAVEEFKIMIRNKHKLGNDDILVFDEKGENEQTVVSRNVKYELRRLPPLSIYSTPFATRPLVKTHAIVNHLGQEMTIVPNEKRWADIVKEMES
jgi:hypothetical protein